MKPIFETAQTVQSLFQSEGWKFCFIGGVALQRCVRQLNKSEPRAIATGLLTTENCLP